MGNGTSRHPTVRKAGMKMKTLDKILKAHSILILDHPFFGSLALRLGLIEDNKFETIATNGKDMYYNSNFIESLTTKELMGVLAHEVMHIALGHLWRKDKREQETWVLAGDYAINGNLTEAGFSLPTGAFIDTKYHSLSTEEIYNQLQQEQQEQNSKDNKKDKKDNKDNKKDDNKDNKKEDKTDRTDPGRCGSTIPTEDKDKQEEKEMEAEWQAAVSQAVQIAKGNLPASIKRQVQEILNPSVPWHILLRDFVERIARNDYDWTRPSRRYIGQGVVLPSLISEQLPEVAIAIDTSGSIDQKALSRFAAEASNVLGNYDTTIRIIYCNNRIQGEKTYTRADFPMKLNPRGGGGTDFRPVFNYIEKQHITPACLIYFTDLYGTFPKQEPEYPTMWLTSTKDKKAPFGITVEFKD